MTNADGVDAQASTPRERFTVAVEELFLAALDVTDLSDTERFTVNRVGALISADRMAQLVNFIEDSW